MNKKILYTLIFSLVILFLNCSKKESFLLSGSFDGVTIFESYNYFTNEELYSRLNHTSTFTDDGILIIDYFNVNEQDTTEWFLNENTNTLLLLYRNTWSQGVEFNLLNFNSDSIVYEGRVRRSIDGQSFLFDQKTTLIKR